MVRASESGGLTAGRDRVGEMRMAGIRRSKVIGAGAAAAVVVSGIAATGFATVAQGADREPVQVPEASASAVESPGVAPTPRAALVSDRGLSRRLIRAGDLGSGWSVLAVDDLVDRYRSRIEGILAGIAVSPAGCAEGWQLPAGYRSHAYRVFRKGGSTFGPYAGQVLASFDSTRSAKKAIADARARVADCSNLEVATDFGTVKVTIRSVKPTGGAGAAYEIGADLGGLMDATGRLSVTRRGRLVSVVGVGSIGSASSFLRSTTARAVARAGSRL